MLCSLHYICVNALIPHALFVFMCLQAFSDHESALPAFEESFWSFFQMDMEQVLSKAGLDDGKVFQVFEQLNSYLLNHGESRFGVFELLSSQFLSSAINFGQTCCITLADVPPSSQLSSQKIGW